MRQGQQNRRGRGRNNHNQHHRKGGQNPLTRSFESTGPDTKIRGTPAHIAEKYMALARDALAAGDPVLAENYLQHAEHYNRIIMAYREQMQQSGEFSNGGSHSQQNRFQSPDADEFSEEGDEFASDQPVVSQGGDPQPQLQPSPQQQRSFDAQRPDDRGQNPGFEGQRGNPRHHNNRDRFGGEQVSRSARSGTIAVTAGIDSSAERGASNASTDNSSRTRKAASSAAGIASGLRLSRMSSRNSCAGPCAGRAARAKRTRLLQRLQIQTIRQASEGLRLRGDRLECCAVS